MRQICSLWIRDRVQSDNFQIQIIEMAYQAMSQARRTQSLPKVPQLHCGWACSLIPFVVTRQPKSCLSERWGELEWNTSYQHKCLWKLTGSEGMNFSAVDIQCGSIWLYQWIWLCVIELPRLKKIIKDCFACQSPVSVWVPVGISWVMSFFTEIRIIIWLM